MRTFDFRLTIYSNGYLAQPKQTTNSFNRNAAFRMKLIDPVGQMLRITAGGFHDNPDITSRSSFRRPLKELLNAPLGVRLRSQQGCIVIFVRTFSMRLSSAAEKLAFPTSEPAQILTSFCFCCKLTTLLDMTHFADSAFSPV